MELGAGVNVAPCFWENTLLFTKSLSNQWAKLPKGV